MRIFVAGATGAISRPLIAQLLGLGHDVVALTRTLERVRTLAAQGVDRDRRCVRCGCGQSCCHSCSARSGD